MDFIEYLAIRRGGKWEENDYNFGLLQLKTALTHVQEALENKE